MTLSNNSRITSGKADNCNLNLTLMARLLDFTSRMKSTGRMIYMTGRMCYMCFIKTHNSSTPHFLH